MDRIASLFQIAGLLLCGASFAYVACGVALQFQRWTLQRRRFENERDLLRQRLTHLVRNDTQVRAVGWDGIRKFQVKWKVRESADCHSFYLVPHDRKPLPEFLPGQYLTIHVRTPVSNKPQVRCYSLSDQPRPDVYRITVKKVAGPKAMGQVSHFLNDQLREGDILDIGSPRGAFTLDPSRSGPSVLLAGGIGITPLLSMLQTLAKAGTGHPVYLFYGVRDGSEHTFKQELQQLAAAHPFLKIITCYSRPTPQDQAQRDFDIPGRITLDLLRRVLPSSNFQFYLCGPSSFTQDLTQGLIQWKVPANAIHSEAFGPAAVKSPQVPSPGRSSGPPSRVQIEFARSQKQIEWAGGEQTLLEAAEAEGISMESGCRAGHCGTCLVAIKRGTVAHLAEPGCPVASGSCLACIAVPDKGPLIVDA